MFKNQVIKRNGLTQAGGSVIFDFAGFEYLAHHQIQIEVSATPAAGTLGIEYRTPGAAEFVAAVGSPIDLTALNISAAFRLDNVYIDALRIVPSLFDADKTYNVVFVSNER